MFVKMILFSCFSLASLDTAWGQGLDQKADPKGSKPDGNASLAPYAGSPLLGSWSRCEALKYPVDMPVPGMPGTGIKTTLQTWTFDEIGTGVTTVSFYQDELCTDSFTMEDKENYKVALDAYLKSMGAAGLSQEHIEEIDEGFKTYVLNFSYFMENPKALTGNFDITVPEDNYTLYSSYRIDENKFYFAEACSAEDVETGEDPNCTSVTGDSAANRATRLGSIPLLRKAS